ncbi:hypothetical protein [Shahe hepe-like virus 2]|uniref:hypothetical protein n=1 Tax=Shahe hepe-like virus 2 TaxID=1923416 RepID=UPI00090A2F14|nr:hypothetical protein [Shahe hepe-like virus 2]APG77718.1 hypothetical protein [Shahe hepe-like virus 2]
MASIQVASETPNGGPDSSFLPPGNKITPSEPQHDNATHMVRRPVDLIQIVEGASPGTVAFSIVLDPTLDAALLSLSKFYTYYRFKKLDFEALATSPFGTASGAMQIAHIPDPMNIIPDSRNAVQQYVRQLGSRMARPRDNTLMTPALQKWRFCKPGTDSRLSSFGAIVGIVRAPPGTGDFAQWAGTVIAEIELCYPTIWTNDSKFTFYEPPFAEFRAATPKANGNYISLELSAISNPFHVPERFEFKTKSPLHITYTYLDEFARKTAVDLTSTVFKAEKVREGIFKIVIDTKIPVGQHSEKISFKMDDEAEFNFSFGTYEADMRPTTLVNKYNRVKQNEH